MMAAFQLKLTVFVLNIMIIRLYILLVSYFLLTWLSGYFGCKVINKLDLTWNWVSWNAAIVVSLLPTDHVSMLCPVALYCSLHLLPFIMHWAAQGHRQPLCGHQSIISMYSESCLCWENWRPFCSGRRSLMRSDNELCFIYTPVVQCCYVTIYWLLQTDSVNTVRWSAAAVR